MNDFFDYELYLMEEREYQKENAELFVYANPHPNELLVSDCVKRAITLATGIPYKDIALALNRYKKQTGQPKYNLRKNWIPFLTKELKATKIQGFTNMKLGEFAKANPIGSYVVKVRKHLVAVINGKVYDTWNPTFKAVCQVFKIK